jgi:hypothetical protein
MTLMLTPHELATLILLVDAPGQVQTDCADSMLYCNTNWRARTSLRRGPYKRARLRAAVTWPKVCG